MAQTCVRSVGVFSWDRHSHPDQYSVCYLCMAGEHSEKPEIWNYSHRHGRRRSGRGPGSDALASKPVPRTWGAGGREGAFTIVGLPTPEPDPRIPEGETRTSVVFRAPQAAPRGKPGRGPASPPHRVPEPPPGLSRGSFYSAIPASTPTIKTDWWSALARAVGRAGLGSPALAPQVRRPRPRCGAAAGSGPRGRLRAGRLRHALRFRNSAPGRPGTLQREFLQCRPALPGRSAALSHAPVGSRADTDPGPTELGDSPCAWRGPPGDGGCPRGPSPLAARPAPPPWELRASAGEEACWPCAALC